jgi:hypothetical protein
MIKSEKIPEIKYIKYQTISIAIFLKSDNYFQDLNHNADLNYL